MILCANCNDDLDFHSETKTIYARFFDKEAEIPKNQKTFTLYLSRNDSWKDSLVKYIRNMLSKTKSATDLGLRHKAIDEYYKYQSLGIRYVYPKDEKDETKIVKGGRVKHYVFGEGVVENITSNYMFAKFDKDTMSRKFLPRSFREFSVL